MTKPDYYKILQVSKDASSEVIASAYRTIMSKHRKHPDLGGDIEEAEAIGEAYAVLSNPASRTVYDALLADDRRRADMPANNSKNSLNENYSGLNRRRADRKTIDSQVSYCVGAGSEWNSARAKDASILGIRLQSKRPFGVNEHLVIVGNDGTAAMHGVVRWQRTAHASVFERIYEAGVEFLDQISDVFERVS